MGPQYGGTIGLHLSFGTQEPVPVTDGSATHPRSGRSACEQGIRVTHSIAKYTLKACKELQDREEVKAAAGGGCSMLGRGHPEAPAAVQPPQRAGTGATLSGQVFWFFKRSWIFGFYMKTTELFLINLMHNIVTYSEA